MTRSERLKELDRLGREILADLIHLVQTDNADEGFIAAIDRALQEAQAPKSGIPVRGCGSEIKA